MGSTKVAPELGDAKSLTKGQVAVLSDKFKKRLMVLALLSGCLFDVLGTVLMIPAGSILSQNAAGGPIEQAAEAYRNQMAASNITVTCCREGTQAWTWSRATYGHPYAFNDIPQGLGYSLTNNIVNLAGQAMTGLGTAVLAPLSDSVGRKPIAQLGLFASVIGYGLIFLSGMVVKSYWMYVGAMALNGFFSVCSPVVSAWFGDMFSKEEAETYINFVTLCNLLGATFGALILMPFIAGRGDNVFYAAFVAMGGAITALIAICFFSVEPPKDRKLADELTDLVLLKKKKEVKEDKTTSQSKKALYVLMLASALDSAGDEGTRIARGSIMQNVYPTTNSVGLQNTIILAVIFCAFGAFALIGITRKWGGLGVPCFLGALSTLLAQMAFFPTLRIEAPTFGPFLAVYFVGKTCGFMSTLAVGLVLNKLASDESKGLWQGRNATYSAVASGFAPIVIALLYDYANVDGNPNRGTTALIATCVISFLATVTYFPLIFMVPRDKDKKKEKVLEEKTHDLDAYEKMSDREWLALEIEEQVSVIRAQIKAGKTIRFTNWGSYKEDRPDLEVLLDRAGKDFEWIKQNTIELLSDRAKMEQQMDARVKMEKMMAASIDMVKARSEMGSWLADYMDDAGYQSWHAYPAIFKAMFLTAFPPLDALDDAKTDYEKITVAEFESINIKMLEVFDEHLKSDAQHKRRKAGVSIAKIVTQVFKKAQ